MPSKIIVDGVVGRMDFCRVVLTPLAWLVNLVVASFPFLNVWCNQSSIAKLFVSHDVCLWNFPIQGDSVLSGDPPDVAEATTVKRERRDSRVETTIS